MVHGFLPCKFRLRSARLPLTRVVRLRRSWQKLAEAQSAEVRATSPRMRVGDALASHRKHDVRALSGEDPRGLETDCTVGAGDYDHRAGQARDAVYRPAGGHTRAAPVMAVGAPKPRTMSQMANKISNRPPGMVETRPAPATPASSRKQPVANAA